MDTKNFDKVSSKFLGQEGSYAVQTEIYDPNFLVPMPREDVRESYGITGKEFVGYDVWHCHEATFLLNNGCPVAGTLKINYPSDSLYMVESKSFKLYLNSFDMCRLGETYEEGVERYEKTIESHLSDILKCCISVQFYSSLHKEPVDYFKKYINLHELIGHSIWIDDYTGQKNHLFFEESEEDHTYYLSTNVLRSRCRHTKQKDTGNAFIYIKTKKSELEIESLFRQIVSLRMVNEFHEFCAEKLFYEIISTGFVSECCVSLLYARRGSLDINPIRSTSVDILPWKFIDVNELSFKQLNQ